MSIILTCVVIGIATGTIAALCGVGGGIIMVPAFVFFLKMDQKAAVGTSLAAMIITALCASARNHGNSLIDWRAALATGASAGLVAWFAAGYLKMLSSVTLTRLFAVFVISVGVYMLFTTRSATKGAAEPAPAKAPESQS